MTRVEPAIEPQARLIIESFVDVVDQMVGRRFDRPEKAQIFKGLLFKIDVESRAALHLTMTNLYPERGVNFKSHSPISVLARSVMESAGQFAFLFLSSRNREEESYHFAVYALHGLLLRQKFDLKPTDEESTTKLIREALDADALRNEILGNPYFSSKSEGYKKEVLVGRLKEPDKKDLPKALGFGETMASTIYRFLSDYSHSGYIALLQVGQPDRSGRMIRCALNYIAECQSLLIERLIEHDFGIKTYVENNLELSRAVRIFSEAAKS